MVDLTRAVERSHTQFARGDELYSAGLALRWLDVTVPLAAFAQDKSAEVVEDLVSKKIAFRSAQGTYVLLNYRDEGPFARYQRDFCMCPTGSGTARCMIGAWWCLMSFQQAVGFRVKPGAGAKEARLRA